jgi:hypothetical protein
MPEGQQQPFNEDLDPWPVAPFLYIERLTIGNGLLYMSIQLLYDLFLPSYQDDLMHVSERPVVEIRRAQRKNLLVDQQGFGMQVSWKII